MRAGSVADGGGDGQVERVGARVFLLSPANLSGVRGGRILRGEAGADFMEPLLAGGTAPLGDVYAFVSSLYYRGKRSYARRFGRGVEGGAGDAALAGDPVLAITPSRGLVPDRAPVSLSELRAFAATDVDPGNPGYVEPLLETAGALAGSLGGGDRVVLLGSIATGKYLDPLARVLGDRLLVPAAFVGRGDMSRGGLLLRRTADGRELAYVAALETERRGSRPPRLSPGPRRGSS